MNDLTRSLSAYAEFLDEQSLGRLDDHTQSNTQGDVIVLDLLTREAQPESDEKTPRRKWLPFTLVAAAIVILLGAVTLFNGGDESSTSVTTDPVVDGDDAAAIDAGLPTMTVAEGEALVGTFVDALKTGDGEGAGSLITGETVGPDFLGWLVALDTSGVRFFECVYEPGSVTCQTTMGADNFYQRIHGQNVEQTFSATLEGGLIVDPRWPASGTDLAADQAFETWAREVHPELTDVMFDGPNSTLGVVLSEDSGQARSQLLDEFLTHRSEQAVDALIGALHANDADAARALVTRPGPADFIGFITALDTSDVEFFDCVYRPASVTCSTRLGASNWFERIHGQNAEQTFSASVENGLIASPTWPADSAALSAESSFRSWAMENHPELDDVMFASAPTGMAFTEESGGARMELLDEYLASLG